MQSTDHPKHLLLIEDDPADAKLAEVLLKKTTPAFYQKYSDKKTRQKV